MLIRCYDNFAIPGRKGFNKTSGFFCEVDELTVTKWGSYSAVHWENNVTSKFDLSRLGILSTSPFGYSKSYEESTQPGTFYPGDKDILGKSFFLFSLLCFIIGVLFFLLLRSRRLEKALKESEKKFRLIFENSSLGNVITGLDGQFIDINESYCQITGYSREDLSSKTWMDIVHENYHSEALFNVEKLLSNESGFFTMEIEARQKSGNHFWARVNVVLIHNSNGDALYFYASIEDITKIHKPQLQITRLLNAVESTGDAIGISDKNGNAVFLNRSMKHLTGFDPDTLNKAGGPIVLYSDKVTAQKAIIDAFSGKSWMGELDLRGKNGRVIPVHASADPIIDKNGRIIGAIGVHSDISERKKAEKALRQSEKKYRKLIDQSADMLIVHDLKGGIVEINQKAVEKYGYSKESLLEMNVSDIDPDYTERQEKGAFWGRLNLNEPHRFEARQKDKKGNIFPVEVTLTKLMLDDQPMIMGLCRDLTDLKNVEKEQKKLQEYFQQAQKMEALGTLSGGIAHDFNNILSSIFGFTELAKLEINDNEALQKRLDQILTAGLRARDLVRHIQTFSRKADLKKDLIQIMPLLKECLKFISASAPRNIKIIHQFNVSHGWVLADPTQLHQVFMNLFTNALHAMKEKGGTLNVNLNATEIFKDKPSQIKELEPGDYLQLTISDTGHGIPDIIKDRIFEPFFTTKKRGEGSGLGLSTVYGILKEMEGAISVYSEVGIGTVFNLLMPNQKKTKGEMIQIKNPTLMRGSGKILVVDDEKSIIKWMDDLLTKLGYEVTSKTSSLDALEEFQGSGDKFDLLLTDMSMPEMDGIELSRKIHSLNPDIPIILSTGFSEDISKETFKSAGIVELLMKPMIAAEVANSVGNAFKMAKE